MSLSVSRIATLMTKCLVATSFTIAAVGLGCFIAPNAAHAAPTPITVSGFNRDLILNNGDSATDTFDVPNNYAFYASGATGSTSAGITSSSFTSATGSGAVYQFADYSLNNALHLGTGNGTVSILPTTGTLTFTTPAAYSSLYLLNSSTNGTGTISYTVNYSDSTTTTGTFTSSDWFNNTGFALSGIGRAGNLNNVPNNGSPTFEAPTNNPRLYETVLTVNGAKTINSVSFTMTSSTDSGRTSSAIFAVSGVAVVTVPESGTLALALPALGMIGAAVIRRRKN